MSLSFNAVPSHHSAFPTTATTSSKYAAANGKETTYTTSSTRQDLTEGMQLALPLNMASASEFDRASSSPPNKLTTDLATALISFVDDSHSSHATARSAKIIQPPLESSTSSDDESQDLASPAYSPDYEEVRSIPVSPKRKPRNKPEGHTARPANAFILYRSQQIRLLKESGAPKKPQSEVSKLIGSMWRDETKANKSMWMELAAQEKARHLEKFPDYRFSPVRRTEPKTKVARPSYASKTSAASKYRRNSSSSTPPSDAIPPRNQERTLSHTSVIPLALAPSLESLSKLSESKRPIPVNSAPPRPSTKSYLPSPVLEGRSLSPATVAPPADNWRKSAQTKARLAPSPPLTALKDLPPSPPYSSAGDYYTLAVQQQRRLSSEGFYPPYTASSRSYSSGPPPSFADTQNYARNPVLNSYWAPRTPDVHPTSQYGSLSHDSSAAPSYSYPNEYIPLPTPQLSDLSHYNSHNQHHTLPGSFQLSPFPPTTASTVGDYFVPAKGAATLHYGGQSLGSEDRTTSYSSWASL